jgi:chromosome segregation ATPase
MRLAVTASASALAFGLLFAACSSDESTAEAAQEEVCSDSTAVKDDLGTLANAITNGDLDDAEDAYDELVESVEELNGGMEDLNDARRDEIQPQVEAIQTAIQDIDVSSLSALETSLQSVQSSVSDAADTISSTSALSC